MKLYSKWTLKQGAFYVSWCHLINCEPMAQRSKFLSLPLLQLWPRTCCLIPVGISHLLFKTRRLAEVLPVWRMLRAKSCLPNQATGRKWLCGLSCVVVRNSVALCWPPPSPEGSCVPGMNPSRACHHPDTWIPPPALKNSNSCDAASPSSVRVVWHFRPGRASWPKYPLGKSEPEKGQNSP